MMHVCSAHQETPTDLEKFLKQGESIKQAFELVSEHGFKTVNRFALCLKVRWYVYVQLYMSH